MGSLRSLLINGMAVISIACGGWVASAFHEGRWPPDRLYALFSASGVVLVAAGVGLLLRRHWGRWLWMVAASAFYLATVVLIVMWGMYAGVFGCIMLIEALGPPWVLCARRWSRWLWVVVFSVYGCFFAFFTWMSAIPSGPEGTGRALAFSMAIATLSHMIAVTGIQFLRSRDTKLAFR